MCNTIYYQVDFIKINSPKNGSCSIIHYIINRCHIFNLTDAGYISTYQDIKQHIDNYYVDKYNYLFPHNKFYFDNIIVTHNDVDHCGGILNLLEDYKVKRIWMLRPLTYAHELIQFFPKYKNIENLKEELQKAYLNLYKIEKIALKKNIQICEPFQGQRIGGSLILGPSKEHFLKMICESEKTPCSKLNEGIENYTITKKAEIIFSDWGEENFSPDETSCENEMSVVQFINAPDCSLLLTGDVGRRGLLNSINYLKSIYKKVPKIDVFEIPHHGSRHNLSTELLDQLFGPRLNFPLQENEARKFIAIVQANGIDKTYPRKVIIRAIHHRGGLICAVSSNWVIIGNKIDDRKGTSISWIPYTKYQDI